MGSSGAEEEEVSSTMSSASISPATITGAAGCAELSVPGLDSCIGVLRLSVVAESPNVKSELAEDAIVGVEEVGVA